MERKGIGIISPANGVLAQFPKRVKKGVEFLYKENFKVKFATNAFKSDSYYSSEVQNRIQDINQLLEDNEINIIMASIGGYNSNQLLPYLNYKLIKEKEKIICGYSDITCILLAIYSKTNIIVYHGPIYMVEMCEYPKPLDYTLEYFYKAINKQKIKYECPSYQVKEYIDWKLQEKNSVERKKEINNNKWKILKKGESKNKIIGGNLSSILTILGSEYLPISIFDEKILFIEDTEISIAEFDSFMQGMKLQGVFKRITGLIIGKFEKEENNKLIKNFLEKFLKEYNIPVIYNIDLGHTNPKITIPIGATAYLKCTDDIVFEITDY